MPKTKQVIRPTEITSLYSAKDSDQLLDVVFGCGSRQVSDLKSIALPTYKSHSCHN